MNPDTAALLKATHGHNLSNTHKATKTHRCYTAASVFYWKVWSDWHVQIVVSDPRPEQRQHTEEREGEGQTAAVDERTDGQTEQPPVFSLQPHLSSDSQPKIIANHHAGLPMVQSASASHTHTHAGRQGYWALGWQRHYSLLHKPLPVFTTSDICCLRLHVWIQDLHW